MNLRPKIYFSEYQEVIVPEFSNISYYKNIFYYCKYRKLELVLFLNTSVALIEVRKRFAT